MYLILNKREVKTEVVKYIILNKHEEKKCGEVLNTK